MIADGTCEVIARVYIHVVPSFTRRSLAARTCYFWLSQFSSYIIITCPLFVKRFAIKSSMFFIVFPGYFLLSFVCMVLDFATLWLRLHSALAQLLIIFNRRSRRESWFAKWENALSSAIAGMMMFPMIKTVKTTYYNEFEIHIHKKNSLYLSILFVWSFTQYMTKQPGPGLKRAGQTLRGFSDSIGEGAMTLAIQDFRPLSWLPCVILFNASTTFPLKNKDDTSLM